MVSFNFASIIKEGFRLNSTTLLDIIKHFPLLREICIFMVEGIDANVLKDISRHCSYLKMIYADAGQIINLAHYYGLNEDEFQKKFLKEEGVNISRLGY